MQMNPRVTAGRHFKPVGVSIDGSAFRGYAPKEPSRLLLNVIERLCAANLSDATIVSIDKLRELVEAWFGLKRSRRWVCYHLKAARREHLIIKQSRWKVVNGRIEIKGRSRYRIAWRHWKRLASNARQAIRLMGAGTLSPGRRETVQKIAHGLQNLLNSVVPSTA